MAYSVVYKKSIHRDLKSLSRADAKRIMDVIEHELIKKPGSNPVLKGQFFGLRKFRGGDYRVVYALIASEILILRIGDPLKSSSRRVGSPSPCAACGRSGESPHPREDSWH